MKRGGRGLRGGVGFVTRCGWGHGGSGGWGLGFQYRRPS